MTHLQFIRIERRLGQPALAKLSGVAQATISLIETGRLNPRPEELDRLARALGVLPDVLMRQVLLDLSAETARQAEAQ